ncbi:hypothetical protein [Mumia quercus]|uniref:hypothetical protein n=1 Tax=Mumia quercus TaxID=2976125 RepID=UPI0021CE7B19|nr:hypothetical protein [Mumia quercus]
MTDAPPRHRERPARRRALLIAALVAGIALTGVVSLMSGLGTVGARGSHAQTTVDVPSTPARSVEMLLHALGEGDVGAACAVAAPDGLPIRTDHALKRCEKALERLMNDLDPRVLEGYRDVSVRGARVEGGNATVEPRHLVDAPVGMRNAVFVLVRAGGAWYVVV